MNLITKIVLIAATILIIGGGCFTLIYFQDDIFGTRITHTTTTEVSTITQNPMPADEAAYINSINSHDAEVVAAINIINGLLANAQIADQGWANQMSAASGEFMNCYYAIRQISTPSRLASFQQYYVDSALGNYYQAVQLIANAVQQSNSSLLVQASANINAGNTARIGFFNQLNAYVASYN
jgi:hypothetical protein